MGGLAAGVARSSAIRIAASVAATTLVGLVLLRLLPDATTQLGLLATVLVVGTAGLAAQAAVLLSERRLGPRLSTRLGHLGRPGGARAMRNDRRRYDVAFYVPWLGPLLASRRGLVTGGAETQVFLLSRELARRGLKVCLLVFEIPGVKLPSSVDGVDVVLRPPYKSGQRLIGKVREVVSIRAALASVEADVVVTRAAGPHVGLIAWFRRRRKFVYSSASPYEFDLARSVPKQRDRALFSFGLRRADEIVVQTGRAGCVVPGPPRPEADAHPEPL